MNIMLEWEKHKNYLFEKIKSSSEDINEYHTEIYNTTCDFSNKIGDVTGDYHNAILNRLDVVSGEDIKGNYAVWCYIDDNALYTFTDTNTVEQIDINWINEQIIQGIKEVDRDLQKFNKQTDLKEMKDIKL